MATTCIELTKLDTDNLQDITWKTLYKADRTIPVPFKLTLDDGAKKMPLVCEEVIRVLPKKRLVAFATWNEKQVVAKLFYQSDRSEHHIQEELEGLQAIRDMRIPTPQLLWQGSTQNNKIHVLIFERINDGASLDLLWQTKNNIDELIPLMRAVTLELATQHVLGIVQEDLHLKNFLVTNKHIYTLDGGSITYFDCVLPRKESLNHLALFFSQLGVGTEKLQEELFQLYAESRGWIVSNADISFLRKAIRTWNQKRWGRFKKKIFRDCSAFVSVKKWMSQTIYSREYQSTEFKKFLNHPESLFNDKNVVMIKNGRSSTVIKVNIDNRNFIIKRYNLKNFWHRLRRCLRPTRARKAWELAQRLYLFGIPTAKPVAFIEKRFFGLRGKSYFVTEFINAPDAGEYFNDYDPSNQKFEKTASDILSLFSNLGKLNMIHGDLKITNILIKNNSPLLIDLDGMKEISSSSALNRAFKKEINRFMKNWLNHPSVHSLFTKLCFPPN